MDTVFLALRVVVSLAAVFGALWFAHRWFVKGRAGTQRARAIGVVARQGLGAKAGVAVVEAGGRRYLLGVTEHAVTVLDRLEVDDGTAVSRGLQVVSTAPVAIQSVAQEAVAGRPAGPFVQFEEELRIATATGEVSVLPPEAGPAGPPTQTITLPPSGAYQTRRAAREAEMAQVQKATGPLAGSVLSPATWRQTADALRQLR
jgi:flagellar protein FliO/FliZ